MSDLEVKDYADSLDVAIVGMTGRFPGAGNVDEFWRNLCDGVESITRFSDEELLAAGVAPAALSDPTYVKAGATLEDIEMFDAAFFGLTPREAQVIDPQQRLFLEEAWKVIERAGYDPDIYDGDIGLFAGTGMSSYLLNNLLPNAALLSSIGELSIVLGNDKDSLATRAAYLMNLTGPCYTLQTYCSTSLVAVGAACEALVGGICDMALAGGVMVAVPQTAGYYYQEGGISSPDGRCRAFDAKAKGAPIGSGVAIVLLKRLADAVADGDTIHAVIKGWAINNDGALRVGYTAPGVQGQTSVIRQALTNAEVDPESIGYIEAHGTGTALGDAVEFQALVRAFGERTDKKRGCALGSVKTNIGHIDRAAGVTGLIKTALALEHALIPPSLNYDEPNPDIDFDATPFFVNTKLREWKTQDGWPRRAGVSSFGIGGTNAHVILEEPPCIPSDEPTRAHQLVLLSGKTAAALQAATDNLCEHLQRNPGIEMADAAYTLQVGRKAFEHRRMLVCNGYEDGLAVLKSRDLARLPGSVQPTQERPISFMFSGVGDHYVGMGRGLYETEPVFRQALDACCDILRPILGLDLREVLYPEGDSEAGSSQEIDLRQMLGRDGVARVSDGSALSQTEIAQPAVFAVEYALVQLLASWSIAPRTLIGYSLGEYVAACVAGVFSLKDALTLVTQRARMIQRLPSGHMVAVPLSEEKVQPFLGEEIDLAIVNGPGTCILAGPSEAVVRLEQRLAEAEITCRRLGTNRAVHSSMMQPLAAELTALVRTIELKPPQLPYVSNVTGRWITDSEATDPEYWARHLCQTVQFGDGLAELLRDRELVLLEIGPGQSLGSFARQHPDCEREQWPRILSTLRCAYERRPDEAVILDTLGRLWLAGYLIEWQDYYARERRRRIPLPAYPFQRERYWIDPVQGEAVSSSRAGGTGKKPDVADWFYVPVWEEAPVEPAPGEVPESWLIFEDAPGWGACLGERLSEGGAKVVRVRVGEAFDQIESDLFVVRPDDRADYDLLFRALEQEDKVPTQVVHMWSVTAAEDEWDFDAAQRVGFYSLLCLAQAAGPRKLIESLCITVVSNGVQPVGDALIQPEKATVLGPCRVIPQEYPNLCCRLVDIAGSAGKDGLDEGLIDRLISELMAATTDVVVAYRAGTRYVQAYEPKSLADDSNQDQLRSRGVYLITGGLGGVGLTLARYLAESVQARLILTGRSGLPARDEWDEWLAANGDDDRVSRKIREVRGLEKMGAEVLVAAADVADLEQMRAVVDRACERFGGLNGVIHAAGQTNPSTFQPIQMADRATSESHFLSKVHGLYVLEEVLQEQDLDFCVLFSSLSSVLGGLAFVAYAAANMFMDIYAYAHNRTGASAWTSVNWDTWKIDRGQGDAQGLGATLAEFAMTPEEGVRAFEKVLNSGETLVVNSTGDLDARIRQWVTFDASRPAAQLEAVSRPELTTAYVPASNEHERVIAAIWQSVLGIDQVGIHDNFFDLGGNSLVGLQLMSSIQRELGVQFPVVALFEAPTVSSLARYLQLETTPVEDTEMDALAERRRRARKRAADGAVAIIGMTGRFPGADGVGQFWENLCNGVESLVFFTDEELLAAGVAPDMLDDPNLVKARPILDRVDLFDARFFNYSPREAELMDPQHRLFLECAWEALEVAGYDPERYKGLIGIFGGTNISSYMLGLSGTGSARLAELANDHYQGVIGNDKDSLTTAVSYKLNLRGPSVAVQTFCSTSLVAVHMACQSLLNGECDIALGGGVSIRFPQKAGYYFQPGGMESPDGHCRTFDAKAQGTTFGDGVGIVVLKRLEEALQDRDTIYAVIKGSAMNNDGSLKAGYTAPSVTGQAEVVRMALENAGIDPETIGYVEAHGTATELGDPIELSSLTRAFFEFTDKTGYCAIGSLKTNMGHLDRAAGVAGLIKTALVVKHGIIPASLNFESPNPGIDFENSPFYVSDALSEWPRANGRPRLAGVNSLGMGGTNAHVIVEQPPDLPPAEPSRAWQLLVLSARTESALEMATENLTRHLRENPDINLPDVAYTLQMGRHTFEHRCVLVCKDVKDALRALETADSHRVFTHYQRSTSRPVVFMFPGVGDHYVQMARELYEAEPVFRDAVEKCCQILLPYLGTKLRDLLYSGKAPALSDQSGELDLRAMLGRDERDTSPEAVKLRETAIAQPVVFAIEYALACLLMSWGVRPHAMVGYSLGEYAAACVSGVLSLEDALRLVAERARMIQSLPPGSMLAVSLSLEEVQPLLSDRVSLAIHNGETMCVLAGSREAIARLENQLAEQEIVCRPLETTHAFHSAMMQQLAERLTEVAQGVQLNPPRIPYISNVTGTWITDEQATDPGYWSQHMCQPVRFFEALNELLQADERVLLEVGPGQSLGSFAKQHPNCGKEQVAAVLPTMRYEHDRRSDLAFLLETVGKLWMLDVEPSWSGLYANESRGRIPLPTYPFERQRFWIEVERGRPSDSGSVKRVSTFEEGLASLPRQELEDWFYLPGWKQTAPLALSLPVSDEETEPGRCWLLFVDTCGVGEKLNQRLIAEGQRVVTVQVGAAFEQLDERRYAVRPGSFPDYEALLRRLRQQALTPGRVVHLWSVTDDEADPKDSLDRTLNLGLYSLIALVQAIGQADLEGCELSIVSSQVQTVTGHERVRPEKAMVLGPCRVVPLEYANVACRSIDVELPASGTWQEEVLLNNLLGELTAGFDDTAIALRGHHRWVEVFEPFSLPSARVKELSRLRQNGVYLITGGLGGIGLALAGCLAQEVQVNLILISRSGLPPRDEWPGILETHGESEDVVRKIRGVQRLEELGAEVQIAPGDVADEEQMATVVREAVARFGTIHGIVHAAGVPGIGLIQLKTPEMAAQVLGPKVQGTLALERVLAAQEITPDFLVLFSSITSATGGGPGQVDYCAANAFLDAYARSHVGSECLTVAVNWGEWKWNAWEEGLGGFDEETQDFFRRNRERFGIAFDEGYEALKHILSCNLPQVVVSTQDFCAIVKGSRQLTTANILQHGGRGAQDTTTLYPRPDLMTPYVAPQTETEQRVVEVWQSILGLEAVGIHDNFLELGGNSLLGIQLLSRLRQFFQVNLPLRVLFEAPTVGEMALAIEDELIKEIEGLTEEEIIRRVGDG